MGNADYPLLNIARLVVAIIALSGSGVAPGAGPDSVRAGGPNRLIDSGSPYLLQHAHNPVDWYPWGDEALQRAKRENKPIFLSVGYSSCYWCHVANRTLYSNPEIAALMNQWFVNVKVDREQRPDIDAIYMRATQLTTGRGGWPNNVFLTPEAKPFFGGSYFPPADDDFGRPGFVTILRAIHETWEARGDEIRAQADRLLAAMGSTLDAGRTGSDIVRPQAWLRGAKRQAMDRFDAAHGGFPFAGSESQFPQEPLLGMLAAAQRTSPDPGAHAKLTATLDAIALGALHDHVGGGFHRYSVDRAWSVPHFEKMLYNNAQLLKLYADAWRVTRKPLYRQVATDTAQYLEQRVSAPDGGFYTAEDAEVGGHEGASYLLSRAEIEAALGAEGAKRLLERYSLTPLPAPRASAFAQEDERGVLRPRLLPASAARLADILSRTAPLRARLLDARNSRPQPARDEKMIVALNGLTIEALATAGRSLGEPGYVRLAQRAADRLWALAYDPRTRSLRHEVFRGRAQGEAFLDDYALLAAGFLALADATRDRAWRERAAQLADDMLRRFAREDGSLSTAPADSALVMAPVDSGDSAYPSGTSAAVALLLRLRAAGGPERYRAAATLVMTSVRARVDAQPDAWPILVAAAALTPNPGVAPVPKVLPVQVAAAAAGFPDTAAHVKVTARVRSALERDEIVVTVKIAAGYHVNANPASFDYLIPTAVSFDGLAPSRIVYPAPKMIHQAFARAGIKVYEGNVAVVAQVPKGSLARSKALTGAVSAQACNDEVCLPPAKLPLHVRATR
ncbi:MAG: DUF255 domain-containing protein [Betaproteobacteria bacterium]|nr:DUF255 domain-containing protein [Betaproteobacteria bacterium]